MVFLVEILCILAAKVNIPPLNVSTDGVIPGMTPKSSIPYFFAFAMFTMSNFRYIGQ
jgi:hypothetical protein